MKQRPLPYHISRPPKGIQKARLDNIALVPASLLLLKGTYQPLANKLPTGSVLCVLGTPRQQKIIEKVIQFLRSHGHSVYTFPLEKITIRKIKRKQPVQAESLRLAV